MSVAMSIPFSKYAGAGNDFILIDNRTAHFPLYETRLLRWLCQRHKGVGADGVVLLELDTHCDFRMRIFNADGSEAEMCGNGLRCLTLFIKELGVPGHSFSIASKFAQHSVEYLGEGQVYTTMGEPHILAWRRELVLPDCTVFVDVLDTGVPHAVLFVESLEEAPVQKWGRHIRYHPDLKPRGVNVNFVTAHPQNPHHLYVRTYERGVEGETLACGTGAAAVALAAARRFQLQPPLFVHPLSGESLTIDYEQHEKNYTQFSITGPATFCFKGSFPLAPSFSPEETLASLASEG